MLFIVQLSHRHSLYFISHVSEDLKRQLLLGFYMTNVLKQQFRKSNERASKSYAKRKAVSGRNTLGSRKRRRGHLDNPTELRKKSEWPELPGKNVLNKVERDKLLSVIKSSLLDLHGGAVEKHRKIGSLYEALREVHESN